MFFKIWLELCWLTRLRFSRRFPMLTALSLDSLFTTCYAGAPKGFVIAGYDVYGLATAKGFVAGVG
jgi:hypothetical protein